MYWLVARLEGFAYDIHFDLKNRLDQSKSRAYCQISLINGFWIGSGPASLTK
jgi:hypothetical protein